MSLDQAITRYQAGDRAVAKAAAEQLVKASPKHGDALNLLAVIALDGGRQADAEVIARRAVATAPVNPLGNCLIAQGRADVVATCDPNQPPIVFFVVKRKHTNGLYNHDTSRKRRFRRYVSNRHNAHRDLARSRA